MDRKILKGSRIKILHLDSEPHVINLVNISLDRNKYDVTGTYSAREALRYLEKDNFNIILSEIIMPGVNGYEFCSIVKEKYKAIPFIFLTIKGQMIDKLHAIDIGADDYITKPFDPIELEARIRLTLGLKN